MIVGRASFRGGARAARRAETVRGASREARAGGSRTSGPPHGALLAFHALKRGTVPINGSTGAVLGRSLTSLQALVDRALSEVRLAAGRQRRERLSVTTIVDEIAATGVLHSEYRSIRFTVAAVDPALVVDGDPQLLTSAVMNLLQNAFKNTPAGGAVLLSAHAQGERLLVEIEDQCGGIPESKGTCSNRSGIDAAVTVLDLASGSRSRGRPCERTEVTSTSAICQARASFSRLTCRWLRRT